jgi:hypothetical protein
MLVGGEHTSRESSSMTNFLISLPHSYTRFQKESSPTFDPLKLAHSRMFAHTQGQQNHHWARKGQKKFPKDGHS